MIEIFLISSLAILRPTDEEAPHSANVKSAKHRAFWFDPKITESPVSRIFILIPHSVTLSSPHPLHLTTGKYAFHRNSCACEISRLFCNLLHNKKAVFNLKKTFNLRISIILRNPSGNLGPRPAVLTMYGQSWPLPTFISSMFNTMPKIKPFHRSFFLGELEFWQVWDFLNWFDF